MIDDWAFEIDGHSNRLYMHFDVSDHFLKLDTFIKTAASARKVIRALDETFFSDNLDYELIVLPPAAGTFLSKLAIVVSGGAAVFGFLNTDIGSAYVEGLTGRTPAEWASSYGKTHRDYMNGFRGPLEELEDHLDADATYEAFEALDLDLSEVAKCVEASRIVVAMVRGLLEKNPDDLEKIGMEFGSLPDAVDARAEFFAACLADPDVKRVGFTPEDEFPIPRNSFPERAQKPTRKPKVEEPPEWQVSVESIYVTSPNWDREDQNARQWKGKDQARHDCYFVIEDAEFWHHVKNKALHVEVLDNLKVQWAFQTTDGRYRNRKVLRVLEFNGEKLADPLLPDAIRAILGQYSEFEASTGQQSLFGF